MPHYIETALLNLESATKWGFIAATIVCGLALAEREKREGLVHLLTGKTWKNARAALRDQKRWEGYMMLFGAVVVMLLELHF